MTHGLVRIMVNASRLLAALCLFPVAAIGADSMPYQVHFETSCSPQVREKFDHAITLLHSFEYGESSRIFNEIIEKDPECAMAHWGAAISIWHPLWVPPGKDDLEAGVKLLARAADLETTPREFAYIDALRAYYSSDDAKTHRLRARAYEQRMAEVYAGNLDDPEAAVFYALALLATADPKDKSYVQQFTATALLNWVRTSNPRHPGVMHYLIHSYDYPGLAHLALDVAKTYAQAAPDSAHAQHMPSHIFTRLGLWDLSISSNDDSARSATEYTARAHLPGHYDEGLHSMDYLMYALLQTARDDEAKALLQRLASIKKTDTENFKVAYTYAASPARYVLERREWQDASELQFIREDFAWDDFGWAQSIHFFARGIGAARSGRPEAARKELAAIEKLRDGLPGTTLPYWKEQAQVHVDSVTSWILFAEGDRANALELAAAAANREDAVDKHPVTPGEVLPARELYADMLLETGAFADALAQYQQVLKHSPNRLNALRGAARAAANSGDAKLAAHFNGAIQQQTRLGEPRRT